MKKIQKTILTLSFVLAATFIATSVNALEYQGRLIKLNTTGDDVRAAQQCLLDMGFPLPVYGADGWYGEETYNQVTDYQRSEGLQYIDGIIGPETAAALTCEQEVQDDQPHLETQLLEIDDVDFDEEDELIKINFEGNFSNSCHTVLEPELAYSKSTFTVTISEEVTQNTDCEDAEEEYEVDFEIDISDLEEGDYEVIVNEEFDFEFEIEEEDKDDSQSSGGSSNTSAMALSSSNDTPNDTASFSFKLDLTPFDDPIYVPANAADAVTVDVVDATDNSVVGGGQTLSISANTSRVAGNDGNEYYKLSSKETFTIKSTSMPGAGDYKGELKNISFTSDNVTDVGFAVFSGVSLNLSDDEWSTETITLLN